MSTDAEKRERLWETARRMWLEEGQEEHYQLRFGLERGATLPTRATDGSAGYDLATMESELVPAARFVVERAGDGQASVRAEHVMVTVDTGVAVEVPEGHVGIVALRSSMAATGLVIPNSVGVIDSDYRGTVKVPLVNLAQSDHPIAAGERIAQLVVVPCLTSEPVGVAGLSETTRGGGGFGSTGA